MNGILVVTSDKKQVAKVKLTRGAFVIGRSPKCSLTIKEPLASREHAEISEESGRYWIRDRESQNGTFVNGQQITDRRQLKDGDRIEIGAIEIKFLSDPGADQEDGAESKATAPMQAASVEKLGQPVTPKIQTSPIRVKLRVLDGPTQATGAVFRDWDGALTIGRGMTNHVALPDDAVSVHHAELVPEGEQFFLVDLDSSNGTFVNGVKIQRKRLLGGERIKIGAATLAFDLVDLRERKRFMKQAAMVASGVVLVALLALVLKPEDVAGKHIEQARQFEKSNRLEDALSAYDKALAIDPRREEARQGHAKVGNELQIGKFLSLAESNAIVLNTVEASRLCKAALNLSATHTRAKALKAEIDSVAHAKVAMEAKNWGASIELLEQAAARFPKSNPIRAILSDARKEANAKQSMDYAKVALKKDILPEAQGHLKAVPDSSSYHSEAQGLLKVISNRLAVASLLSEAKTFYRLGKIPEASTKVQEALGVLPGDEQLIQFNKLLSTMKENSVTLDSTTNLSGVSEVGQLLVGVKACERVLTIEADPVNVYRTKAEVQLERIRTLLRQISNEHAAKAKQLMDTLGLAGVVSADQVLDPKVLEKAKQLKQVKALYDSSFEADPTNETARASAREVGAQITAICKELEKRGEAFRDFNPGAMQTSFKAIKEIDVPNGEFLRRAEQKLR